MNDNGNQRYATTENDSCSGLEFLAEFYQNSYKKFFCLSLRVPVTFYNRKRLIHATNYFHKEHDSRRNGLFQDSCKLIEIHRAAKGFFIELRRGTPPSFGLCNGIVVQATIVNAGPKQIRKIKYP